MNNSVFEKLFFDFVNKNNSSPTHSQMSAQSRVIFCSHGGASTFRPDLDVSAVGFPPDVVPPDTSSASSGEVGHAADEEVEFRSPTAHHDHPDHAGAHPPVVPPIAALRTPSSSPSPAAAAADNINTFTNTDEITLYASFPTYAPHADLPDLPGGRHPPTSPESQIFHAHDTTVQDLGLLRASTSATSSATMATEVSCMLSSVSTPSPPGSGTASATSGTNWDGMNGNGSGTNGDGMNGSGGTSGGSGTNSGRSGGTAEQTHGEWSMLHSDVEREVQIETDFLHSAWLRAPVFEKRAAELNTRVARMLFVQEAWNRYDVVPHFCAGY